MGELGLPSYVYDLTPEQWYSALGRLDLMMSEWEARGISVGYPLPMAPEDSALDQDGQCPDAAHAAIVLNLAIRLAPGYGKSIPIELARSAKGALDVLRAWVITPGVTEPDGSVPAGAGYKRPDTVVIPHDVTIDAGTDDSLTVA